jgi:phosphoglycerate kinase
MASALEGIHRIDEFDLNQQRVFIRVDFNVPIQNGVITDDNRIQAALPTIRYALEHKAKVILASHFGRPEKGGERSQYSLEPVAQRLNELLGYEVILVDDPASDAPKGLLQGLQKNQLIMLENLRFDKGETENSREFAVQMAAYTDIYINDAFGASHRAHASIDELPKCVAKKGIGFLMAKEIEMLSRVTDHPEHPFVMVLGGAKVSDKINMIEHLIDRVDTFIVGGAMAYTFLAAQGLSVGSSRVEKDKLAFARDLLGRAEARHKTLLLPVDHVVGEKFDVATTTQITATAAIGEGWMGLDIGPKTIRLFSEAIATGKTIFWNGPMGVFEMAPFAQGTFAIAKAMSQNSGQTIVGGGDSAAAAKESGFAESFTHISTGGGASLEFLQGDKLPGLEALRHKRRLSV